jgi:hypothetical protein
MYFGRTSGSNSRMVASRWECLHEWCVSNGEVYKSVEADKAFGELPALYRKVLG